MKGARVRQLILPLVLAGIVLATGGFMMAGDTDLYLKIDRGITLFGRVYKEIAANYVDEVDPEKFMEAGIDGMLGTLDPYTVYISKEEGDEVDLLTSGKYGGIGVTIGLRDGALRIISVMDGYSAQRQGIVPGDVLTEVDGVPVGAKKADDVRNLTRGEPGTEVRVKIKRQGEDEPLSFTLLREEIQLHNVTYTDYISPGVGYVRLERFSRRAGEELRQAVRDLKARGELKELVLDLRGNPGGLLDAAVDVAGKFLPRGSLVVSTRGRSTENEKKYTSTDEPVVPAIPVAVLTDHGSASASEIVAGALQDLDRAIVIGTRTFGKGLVQTILPLNYGAQLKITTARYYTPSGRSIQEVDYQHKDKNGVFTTVPDSMRKQFKTAHGRVVYERGGVLPDTVVTETDEGPMVRELTRKALFFKFANAYAAAHKGQEFKAIDQRGLQEFREFLAKEKFDFVEDSESKLKELRKLAEQLHYSKEVMTDLDHMTTLINNEKQRAFDRYQDHIADELNQELASRYKGEKGRIEASLQKDAQLRTAVTILKNKSLYQQKLAG